MIEIKRLTKTYPGPVHALCGIDLTIGEGMFGLVGPNGAGKTSLMRILAGLIRPTSGSVHVFGHDVTTDAGRFAAKATLGYLPQEFGVYPNLTACEFLDYVASLKGIAARAARQRQIADALASVRLTEAAHRRLHTYSGGMKRRVGIAQALLGTPRWLIVDEPTAGLDPEERIRVRNLLSEMAAGRTVILSTHIVEDISQSCNDLAVVNKGRVLFRGSPHELVARARGRVWTIATSGERPEGELVVVSSLQTQPAVQGKVQFRVVGQPDAHYNAQPAEPSLEDGYMWLMSETRAQGRTDSS